MRAAASGPRGLALETGRPEVGVRIHINMMGLTGWCFPWVPSTPT